MSEDARLREGPVLPPVQPPTELPVGTCDWGNCNAEATGVRWWQPRNQSIAPQWLAVCERHLVEAPSHEGVRLA